jgi:hypothetical protein
MVPLAMEWDILVWWHGSESSLTRILQGRSGAPCSHHRDCLLLMVINPSEDTLSSSPPLTGGEVARGIMLLLVTPILFGSLHGDRPLAPYRQDGGASAYHWLIGGASSTSPQF